MSNIQVMCRKEFGRNSEKNHKGQPQRMQVHLGSVEGGRQDISEVYPSVSSPSCEKIQSQGYILIHSYFFSICYAYLYFSMLACRNLTLERPEPSTVVCLRACRIGSRQFIPLVNIAGVIDSDVSNYSCTFSQHLQLWGSLLSHCGYVESQTDLQVIKVLSGLFR